MMYLYCKYIELTRDSYIAYIAVVNHTFPPVITDSAQGNLQLSECKK